MHTGRIVQGMLVAQFHGHSDANTLQVFNIPDDDMDEFLDWLDIEHDETADLLRHADGYTPLGSRQKLAQIAAEYKAAGHPDTTIGWSTVPMKSNTIVLWRGPHCVTKADPKRHVSNFRSALYLQLQTRAPHKRLPVSQHDETFAPMEPDACATHIDLDRAAAERLHPLPYGWNERTIPPNVQHMFSKRPGGSWAPRTPAGPARKRKCTEHNAPDDSLPGKCTPELRALRTKGYVVLENVLPDTTADALHRTIADCVRGMLFDVPRRGMCPALQHEVLGWSLDEFVSRVNEPRLKKARYYKSDSLDLFCGYDADVSKARRMTNLQSVHGFRLNTQMIDVYAHPFFAHCLASVHERLRRALSVRRLYFGKERCSLRSCGSRELAPHVDEPIRKGVL